MTILNKKNKRQKRSPGSIVFMLLMLLVVVAGCHTMKPTVEIRYKTLEKTNYKTQHDSVYVHDSIIVHRDSTIERYRDRYLLKYINTNDTLIKTDTIVKYITQSLPAEKAKKGFVWWSGLISIAIVVFYLLFKLATKTPVISHLKNILSLFKK